MFYNFLKKKRTFKDHLKLNVFVRFWYFQKHPFLISHSPWVAGAAAQCTVVPVLGRHDGSWIISQEPRRAWVQFLQSCTLARGLPEHCRQLHQGAQWATEAALSPLWNRGSYSTPLDGVLPCLERYSRYVIRAGTYHHWHVEDWQCGTHRNSWSHNLSLAQRTHCVESLWAR